MSRARILKLTFSIGAVLWLFVVTIIYYIVHKPFTANNALAILDALANVIVAGALFTLAAAFGRHLTRAFEFASSLEAVIFHAGLGLGLISLTTFVFGWVGLLQRILFWLLLVVAAFLLRKDLSFAWRSLASLRLPIDSRFERALAFFTAVSLVLAFLFALTPPTAWDAQTYHLVEAKVALERGRIAAPPDIPYFSFPSLVEMLFLAGMLLKGDIAAQLIHFGFFLLLLGALFAFAIRYFNSRVAWLSSAILVAVPSLLLNSTWAYVDLALVFYAFSAFYALAIAHDTNHWRWYALAGALAGMAASVKYTGAIVPLALVFLIFLYRRLSFVVVYLALVILFAAPWYIRNLVFTGNPVYPFLFGGIYWDAFRANWFSRFGSGLITTPIKLLTAFWDATVFGVEGTLDYGATIGPLLLTLLPLLLLSPFFRNREEKQALRDALVFSAALYAFWLMGIAESKLLLQTRLLFVAFPTLALAAAAALDHLNALDLPQFSIQRLARLVVALILGLTLLNYVLAFASNSPLAYLAGAESREDFLTQSLGDYYRAVQFINTQLPAKSKIVALWEPRSYYIRRAIQPDAILDGFEHQLAQSRDVDVIAQTWQQEGYTHVLLNRGGLSQYLTSKYDPIEFDDVRILQELLARHARLIYPEGLDFTGGEIARADGALYAVYELNSVKP